MNDPTTAPETVTTSTNVAEFLRLLHPDGVFEVRIPETPDRKGGSFKATASGYFNDHEAAEKKVNQWSKIEPVGIYCTLNPVNSALLARSINAIKFKAGSATEKADIVSRRWLMVDIDPKRPCKTSASKAENKAAVRASVKARMWLADRGWPMPIRMMSGNGAYLLYRVDLPNDDESLNLVASFLRILGERFNSDAVDFDQRVKDACRILKIGGTWARKGDNLVGFDGIEDRPHRQSYFVAPKQVEVVRRELIELLVAEFPEAENDRAAAVSASTASQVSCASSPAIIERCRKYLASMAPAIAGQNGSDKTLEAGATIERFGLPFDAGLILMREYNVRCQPHWDDRDLERKLSEGMKKAANAGETGRMLENDKQQATSTTRSPEYQSIAPGERVHAGDRGNLGEIVSDDGDSCTVQFVSKEGNTATKSLHKSELRTMDGTPLVSSAEQPRTFAGIDATELAKYVDAKTDWLVDGIFAADQPTVFGAASKATKTTQLVDLSVSLATTTSWLGTFPVSKKRKVLFITGESNYRSASKRFKRALDVRGLSWNDAANHLRVEAMEFPSLPSPSDRAAIARDVKERGIEVVIIDPLYRGLQGLDLFKMNEVGEAIIQFVKSCQPASVVISHHVVKTAAREMAQPTLEDLSGAGLAESAGNWWLIGRNVPYAFDRVHDLSVVYGGRDEQAGLKRVVFNEAEWTAEITSGHDVQQQRAKDARNRKQRAKEQQVSEAKAGVKHALANEKIPRPKSWVEQRSGQSQTITRIAIAELLNDLSIVEQPYADSLNRQRDGLILAAMVDKTMA